jgi:hypothetical protein
MSISIALTKEQRGLLQEALEIARDQFKENARASALQTKAKHKRQNRPAARFADRAKKEAQQLLVWIANAQNVIIEEPND